ncbi:MAG TPA: SAM-dependent methyltransferase [Streptosporangiaceae bacterium]
MIREKLASQTALTAAAARAAHLIVDRDPVIFVDTLAGRLLGAQAGEFIGYHRAHGTHLVLASARGQAVCRSRYTEDSLATAIRGGITQYVILGAGLDSFGYRSPLAGQVRVFEVDHPATSELKRERLAAAGLAVPPTVTLVPFNFASGALTRTLAGSGLDLARPAFVSLLGVTMYLTASEIGQTLAEVGRLAPGTELVADYMLPAGLRDATGDAYAEQVMPVAAQRGEPWLTFLSPDEMSALLTGHGFGLVRQVAQRDVGDAATWVRTDSLRPVELSLIAHATVVRGS